MTEHDRRYGRQRGAGRDADQARIGKRISKKALHHRAGRSEGGADERGKKSSRQSEIDEHKPVAFRGRVVSGSEPCRYRTRQRLAVTPLSGLSPEIGPPPEATVR